MCRRHPTPVAKQRPELRTRRLPPRPAGLDLGADEPSEIALSIIAEILPVLRRTTAMALRNRTGRIHDSSDESAIVRRVVATRLTALSD